MLTVRLDQGIGVIGRVLIAPDRRGSGLGAALMQELVAVGFDQLGLHRLQLNVYDFNTGAVACYQRAGFVIEGRMRDSTRGTTGYWSGYLMALLEPQHRARLARGSRDRSVRPARFADAPALARLLTELGYPQDAEQARAQLATWAGDPRGTVLVADSDGSPAGFVAAYAIRRMDRPDSFARVVALAVDPGRQRSGLGRRLLAAVEAWARETGCGEIEITSSRSREDAHAFYRALGFTDLCERSARFRRALS
jgi:GNAT superfamily N-acetyltransferase